MNIAVLGAGMVGRAIALDLARDFKVTSFDLNTENLDRLKKRNPDIETRQADLSRYAEYAQWLSPYDIVVTAVPGFMGYKTLEAVIRCGKHVADISFFPEDALQLDALAKEKGVTAITDCGVAPGMSNLILGKYNAELKIRSFACYVGGLPKHPKPPFFYKAPFSPVDVIEEYIRPARMVENGSVVTRPALSDREMMAFDRVGKLEAFNTDGLRTLLHTMRHIPDMKEKTLRYPGHADLITALQQAGFFSKIPVQTGDAVLAPLQLTTRLLVDQWKLADEEEEFTVMKLIVRSDEKTVVYDLYDEYDPVSRMSSMARSTGFTCAAAVHLIAQKLFTDKGLFPPELVGSQSGCFLFVLRYLEERNVRWIKTETMH